MAGNPESLQRFDFDDAESFLRLRISIIMVNFAD